MILKQTVKNHFIISGFVWVLTIIFFIGWWYFKFDYDYLLIVGLFHLFLTIPALYLHIEYSIRNWNEIIEISEGIITINRKEIAYKFIADELTEISLYQSANLDKWGIPFTAMDYYRYMRITLKNDKEIIITCLLSRHFKDIISQFGNIPFKRHKFAINSILIDHKKKYFSE